MRNFARINNYYNRIEAERDWRRIAVAALRCGYAVIVRDIIPAEPATVKQFDTAIAELRKRIAGDGI